MRMWVSSLASLSGLKRSGIDASCGVGCRPGADLTLLWPCCTFGPGERKKKKGCPTLHKNSKLYAILTCPVPVSPHPHSATGSIVAGWKPAAHNHGENEHPGSHQRKQNRIGAPSQSSSQRTVIIWSSRKPHLQTFYLTILELSQLKSFFTKGWGGKHLLKTIWSYYLRLHLPEAVENSWGK